MKVCVRIIDYGIDLKQSFILMWCALISFDDDGGKSMARISISFNRKLDGSLKLVIMSKVNSYTEDVDKLSISILL